MRRLSLLEFAGQRTRKDKATQRIPKLCIGVPSSLLPNTKFHLCRKKPHKAGHRVSRELSLGWGMFRLHQEEGRVLLNMQGVQLGAKRGMH